jgi:hypothetical protein
MYETPVVTAGIAGAFAKLRKVALRLVMSVCMEKLGSHWTDFHIFHLNMFRNLSRKFKLDRNLIRISSTVREDISPNSTYIETFQTKIVEKIKARILYLVTFPENLFMR